ncbi:MAG: efflux RND transporter permease subunit, partial [Phenylobacterium sp.]
FLPMAFFGGSIGVIYRQFSITIVSSMVLSVIVALVLSPALAATLLRRPDLNRAPRNGFGAGAKRLGDRFNASFKVISTRYQSGVRAVIARTRMAMLIYAGLAVVLVVVFVRLPTSFLPVEDQGVAQAQFTLPPGASQSRTKAAAKAVENYFLGAEKSNVNQIFDVVGQGPGGTGQNAGRAFIAFKPWADRKGKANAAGSITQRATHALSSLRDVQFVALNPPSVRGLGQSSGFTLELQNTGGLSRAEFESRLNQLLSEAGEDPVLTGVRLNALEDRPTLKVDIDQEKVGALGLSQDDVDTTLSTAWGGDYVNDFVDRGRVKRVFVEGDAPYRSRPEDLAAWYVRSANGGMAPFSAFARTRWERTPTTLLRFNGISAYEVMGDASLGYSSGQAMDHVAAIAAKLPGTSVAWSNLSYQERLSGGQAPILYALSLLVVFLCLAALYESWSVPFSVMLVIPLGLIGAALAVWGRGLSNDVYFQVGLLTTMGLSAKNAILIVEFAEGAERRGLTA